MGCGVRGCRGCRGVAEVVYVDASNQKLIYYDPGRIPLLTRAAAGWTQLGVHNLWLQMGSPNLEENSIQYLSGRLLLLECPA